MSGIAWSAADPWAFASLSYDGRVSELDLVLCVQFGVLIICKKMNRSLESCIIKFAKYLESMKDFEQISRLLTFLKESIHKRLY